MKFSYYQETDSLYISLIDRPSTHSEEVSEGICLDFDENNRLVGIDIDRASRIVDLSTIELGSPLMFPQLLAVSSDNTLLP